MSDVECDEARAQLAALTATDEEPEGETIPGAAIARVREHCRRSQSNDTAAIYWYFNTDIERILAALDRVTADNQYKCRQLLSANNEADALRAERRRLRAEIARFEAQVVRALNDLKLRRMANDADNQYNEATGGGK